jgi:hypothetical protein
MVEVPVVINRRTDDRKFHIDWGLNVGNIITLVLLLITLINYGGQIVTYLKSINAKTNIMWSHFDKSQLSKDELLKLGIQ